MAYGCGAATGPCREDELPIWQSVSELLPPELVECVRRSLPKAEGQRDACVLKFVQHLKQYLPRHAAPEQLEMLFHQWWRVAVNLVATRCYATSLRAFQRAWSRVELPRSETRPQRAAREAAKECGPALTRLFAAMVAKQRAVGTVEFFYSERDMERDLGCSRTKVRSLLSDLIALGEIVVARPGRPSPNDRTGTTVYRIPNSEPRHRK